MIHHILQLLNIEFTSFSSTWLCSGENFTETYGHRRRGRRGADLRFVPWRLRPWGALGDGFYDHWLKGELKDLVAINGEHPVVKNGCYIWWIDGEWWLMGSWMGFHSHGWYPNSWMVYKGKSDMKMDDLGVAPFMEPLKWKLEPPMVRKNSHGLRWKFFPSNPMKLSLIF